MCGITGIWNRSGEPVAPPTIERFTQALAHRGPDGAGTSIDADACLALGHRRLSILDPTAGGRQPMRSVDGRYWVTYNGEIYNFVELRAELETLGYRFATQTDTEVIAAAYDRWGEACLLRFNGMWAFALWDVRARRLFASRDRFGVKPFFYSWRPERFAFASELKAFLALDGFAAREHTPALARMLDDPFAAEAFDDTLLDGVTRLLPGHCLTATVEALQVRRWWNTLDHLVDPPRSLNRQARELRELLFDAARLRLRSDVPIGIALSGGLDSSSVLSTLVALDGGRQAVDGLERAAPAWKRAFTATYVGTPLDELRFAQLVARAVDVPLTEIPVDSACTAERFARVMWDLEEPWFTDPTPVWSLYGTLRDNAVSVALNGDGADELFGGYVHHADHALRTAGGFIRGPRRFADLIATRHGMTARDGPVGRTRRRVLAIANDDVLRALTRPARALYRRVRPRRSARGAGGGYARHAMIRDYQQSDLPQRAAAEALGAGLTPLGAFLYAEFHALKLPAILRMFDRASMAHGVEIRNAFLDWRIVRYAFSLPDESKIGGGYSKRVLREAMRGIVPEAVRARRTKIGFNAPLPQWFAGPLRDWLWDLVNEPGFIDSELWDGRALLAFVANRRDGAAWNWGEGEALWPFLHAYLWRANFLKGVPDRR